jgi:hypothetical protein
MKYADSAQKLNTRIVFQLTRFTIVIHLELQKLLERGASTAACWLLICLLSLLFYTEDGGSTSLRNVSKLLLGYTTS